MTPILCLVGVLGYRQTEVATGVAKVAIDQSIFDDVAWVAIRESELSQTSSPDELDRIAEWKYGV